MRRWLAGICVLLLVALLGGGAFALARSDGAQVEAKLSVAAALGGEAEGFARASAPRPFVFPADHGPHDEFRNEWWYFTGNLAAADGRRFGYQLTFFRSALAPQPPARQSAWGANQVYMAHFALSDVGGGRFFAFERFSRAALGLAGAQAVPFRVWLEGWSAQGEGAEIFPLRLRASEGEVAVDFILQAGKPVVLQGEGGLSRKGPEAGNASYYYSFTRLPTAGSVRVGGEEFAVEGASWLDREWSTSALGPEQAGWDWYALQLDDGRELTFYELRRRDGSRDPFSAGTLVAVDGLSRPLGPAAVEIAVLKRWQSPRGAVYPAGWRLRVAGEELDLEVTPYLADQELDVSLRYWEGAVRVVGTSRGRPVSGHGYVELTGYADAQGGQ